VDGDCNAACNYAHMCIDTPSCKPHLGGDTCGKGEVEDPDAVHESCCRTLPVSGFTDPRYPDKSVYLDKYEITTGRIRAFIQAIAAKYNGVPNVREWVKGETPPIWNHDWDKFLPSDFQGDTVHVNRLLLGDRRPNEPDAPIPDADRDQQTGVNFQFNSELYVY